MSKIFFKGIRFNSYGSTEEMLKNLINYKLLIAINPKGDDGEYVVYVQPNIQRLADAFEISIPNKEVQNYFKAAHLALDYDEKIKNNLLSAVEEHLKCLMSLKEGNIDFIDCYSDKITMNRMIKSLVEVFEISNFEKLQDLCKRLSFNENLSDVREKINKLIESKEYNSDELAKKLRKNFSNITSANCFSRETFAMLYVRFEKYVKEEKALQKEMITYMNSCKMMETITVEG